MTILARLTGRRRKPGGEDMGSPGRATQEGGEQHKVVGHDALQTRRRELALVHHLGAPQT